MADAPSPKSIVITQEFRELAKLANHQVCTAVEMVKEIGERERILPTSLVESFVNEGVQIVTQSGIAQVERYCFRLD